MKGISILSIVFFLLCSVTINGESMVLATTQVDADQFQQLLDPSSGSWGMIARQVLKLNRTPPLTAADPDDDGYRPQGYVQIVKSAEKTLVLISWQDETENTLGQGKKFPDAGEDRVYNIHSMDVSGFADAVCIMLSEREPAAGSFPSLVMGENGKQVNLFFWKSGRGFSLLTGEGRSKTELVAGVVPEGKAVRTASGWAVVMVFENLAAKTAIAFACWDGSRSHRDGLKYFSVWYELE